jgi:hypothetical protein
MGRGLKSCQIDAVITMFAGIQRRMSLPCLQQSLLFAIVALLAASLSPQASHADAVDIAVDAFVVGGATMGVPISPSEASIIKPLVRCIAVQGKPVLECSKETVISQLPQETRGLVNCITGGKPVVECGKEEAFKHLPPQTKELANCVATGQNVAQCGAQFAVTQAEKAAFATVDKLKVEAQDKFKEATSGIQNIINVVDGIVRQDWQKVLENGGKAVAKYVVKTVISSLLTPATTAIIGPVIDTVIDNRFDLVKDLVNALQSGDYAQLPRILAEAYVTSYFEIACALIPAGAVKEAICGSLGKVIAAAGKVVGDVIGTVVGVIKDVLGAIGGAFDAIGKGIAGKDDNCGSPEAYYAANTLMCYNRAALLKMSQPGAFAQFENDVYHRCRQHFIRCEYSETVTRICGPMRDLFNQHVDQLYKALLESANAYARSRQTYMEAQRARVCSPQFASGEADNFLNGCENRLKKNFPLGGDALSPDCKPNAKRCEGLLFCPEASAQQAACKAAVDDGDWKRTTADVCKGAGKCFPIDNTKPTGPIVR